MFYFVANYINKEDAAHFLFNIYNSIVIQFLVSGG